MSQNEYFRFKMAILVVLSLDGLRPTIRQVQIARSLTKIALIQLQKRSFRLGIRSMKNSFNSYQILSMYIMNKVTLIKNSLHTLMKKEAFLGKARLQSLPLTFSELTVQLLTSGLAPGAFLQPLEEPRRPRRHRSGFSRAQLWRRQTASTSTGDLFLKDPLRIFGCNAQQLRRME